MSGPRNSFDSVLLSTIKRALVEVLGEKVAKALRFYVDLETALTNPDSFLILISTLVSPERAVILQKRVLEDLHSRFGSVYKPRQAKFSVEIAELRSKAAH